MTVLYMKVSNDKYELPEIIARTTIELAEKCTECAQASLKMFRALNGDTPVSQMDAREHLIEEIADVSVCMTALHDVAPLSDVGEIIVEKAQRWEQRINAGQDPDARRKMMEEAYHES